MGPHTAGQTVSGRTVSGKTVPLVASRLFAVALATGLAGCSPGDDGGVPSARPSPTAATSSRFPVTCIVEPVALEALSPGETGADRPERAALDYVVQATGVARSLTRRTPDYAEVYLTRANEIIAQVVLRNYGNGWLVRLVRSCGQGLILPSASGPTEPMGP